MRAEQQALERELAQTFAAHHPREAARVLETLPAEALVRHLEAEPIEHVARVLEQMDPETAANSIANMGEETARQLLPAMNPMRLGSLLARLDGPRREQRLTLVDETLAEELQAIITYPPDTAGHLMDPRFLVYGPEATAGDVVSKLQAFREKRILDVLLVDQDGRLAGMLPLQSILLAEPDARLQDLVGEPPPAVHAMTPRTEVTERLTRQHLTTLPVVDLDNHVLGVIRHASLVHAVREEVSANLQTMMWVAKEERALSPPLFSVRKRLPWLNINLFTAFLAAAVVGMFEGTIARFTALAILLPVVAGQSGNTGMQALAVTMRGLSLREVRPRQWLRLLAKEAAVGAVNGVAVGLVTMVGTFVWSRSVGLCAIIGVSMVISMVIAGVAGAAIPLLLTVANQDPAQSSSIILTTVTDVMGFLSFLGLATLFSQLL